MTLSATTLLLASTIMAAPVMARAQPIVLELFTSQSCSSCPPADRLLSELAQRPGLLALDMHVDYWNGVGWHDPYSSAAVSRRQSRYAAALKQDSVYTPELVVAGTYGVVGSDRAAVAAAIDLARAEVATTPPVKLRLHRSGAGLVAAVGAGQGDATLWLVGYDRSHQTRIGGGENGGRTLVETNIVTSLSPVANWSGAPVQLTLAPPAGETAALLLQASNGRIVAAAALDARSYRPAWSLTRTQEGRSGALPPNPRWGQAPAGSTGQ